MITIILWEKKNQTFNHFATFTRIGKDAFIFCHAVLSLKHPVSFSRNTWQLIFSSFTLLQLLIAYLQSFNQEEKRNRLENFSICQQSYVLEWNIYSLNIENFMASIISVIKGTKVLLILKECRTIKTISHFDSCYEDYYQMLCLLD